MNEVTKIVEIVNDEDRVYGVYLPNDYRSYLIDGKIVSPNYNQRLFKVKNPEDIRIVRIEKVISHFENATGDVISVEEYEAENDRLLSFSERNDYSERNVFENLDDEYNYKKFKKNWIAVYRDIQTVSEPIYVEYETVKTDTGNPFIESYFLTSEKENDEFSVYIYKRESAVISICRKVFSEFGMEYQEGVSYSGTEGKMIWSNSSHSGIRYAVAFGKYIFGDEWKITGSYRGTIQQCFELYEKDEKRIRDIITKGYNLHFGRINANGMDFSSLISNLDSARNSLVKVESKVSTVNERRNAIRFLDNAIKIISDFVAKGE